MSDDDHRRALLEARVAFERGDYASVRARVTALKAQAGLPEDVHKEADALVASIRPDRAALYLALGCLAFFLVVLFTYVV